MSEALQSACRVAEQLRETDAAEFSRDETAIMALYYEVRRLSSANTALLADKPTAAEYEAVCTANHRLEREVAALRAALANCGGWMAAQIAVQRSRVWSVEIYSRDTWKELVRCEEAARAALGPANSRANCTLVAFDGAERTVTLQFEQAPSAFIGERWVAMKAQP